MKFLRTASQEFYVRMLPLPRSRKCRSLLLATVTAACSIAHALAQAAPAAPDAPHSIVPMPANAHPSFAVAAIKPHNPDIHRQGFHTAGNRLTIQNETVASLLNFAYSINTHQIVDAPDWFAKEAFDIDGRADAEGEPSLTQMQQMVQSLLAERFNLKFHRERRELSVYAIYLAKGGPKLTPAAHPDAQPDQQGNSHGTEMTQTYTSASMANFILGMQFFLDRPILDRTGLTGRYDFTFRYTSDEAHTTDPNAPPGIFTAVQEQLGLKLEPKKDLADVLVIDHAERPSEN